MNKTNKSLVSNRFLKLEREIFEILSKSKETLHLKEIKSNSSQKKP